MKKLLALLLFATAYSFATPPLLLKPNTATINIEGTPSDTVVTLPRLLLVEYITYSGFDSTVTVSFNSYFNLKEYRAGRSIKTNIPLSVPPFKNVVGGSATLTLILQQARQYYISLGYTAQ